MAKQPKAPADLSAWGATPPDWIVALAREVDATSQVRAAGRIGVSSTTVNRVLSHTYAGRYEKAEDAVRAHLLSDRIVCPYQGDIPAASCLNARQAPKASTAPHAVKCRMERARGCIHGGGNV